MKKAPGFASLPKKVKARKGSKREQREFEITFSVSGYVTQNVLITDPKITAHQLQSMLETGRAMTTMQEGGVVIVTRTDRVIGKVVDVDNNCQYEDFDVEDNDAY
jgi:hypothetical protein